MNKRSLYHAPKFRLKGIHFAALTSGKTTYGYMPIIMSGVDDISLSYKGARLVKADDSGEDSMLAGANDFCERERKAKEYYYNFDGLLTRDLNKGVSISYNLLGLPAQVTEGENRIRYTYAADGTLLRSEYGMYRMELYPNGGVTAEGCAAADGGVSTLAQSVFEVHGWHDRCGAFEYTDGRIERIQHEAGWIDSQGRHVAAIRDSRGSLRATLTSGSVKPAQSGGSGGGLGGGSLGGGLQIGGGIALPQTVGYDNLTAYYPYGLPFADWQGDGRDLFAGKELERASGLLTYDFHARQYDPQLGMFLTPDPLADSYTHLNPYLYCAANPVSYTDPTGCVIKSENSTHLEILKSDLIFALNFDEIDSQKADDLLEINYKKKEFSTINNESFTNFVDGLSLSEEQNYILQYIYCAINNKKNTFYVDYTPDEEKLPGRLQGTLNSIFSKGDVRIGEYKEQSFYGDFRNSEGGTLTVEYKKGGYSTINPADEQTIRAQNAVHEVLGHSAGYALGYKGNNYYSNNAHALQMERCFNKIHGLGDPKRNNHPVPFNFDVTQKNYLRINW